MAPGKSGGFVARMEQVLEVCKRPEDPKRPVVCMDEAPRQLIGETRLPLPAQPGQPQRYDFEYERKGTCNVFMAVEPLAGKRLAEVIATKKAADYTGFLQAISTHWPEAEKITLVQDNLNTHTAGSVYETLPPAQARALLERFEFVYTPKHGSWLNMAEIEINSLVKQCLDRRIPSIEQMRSEVSLWQHQRNDAKDIIRWRFTTDDARIKLHRLYPTIEG